MVDSLTANSATGSCHASAARTPNPKCWSAGCCTPKGTGTGSTLQDLPGTPDLVFRGRHQVIFVNGCFWHSHSCPNGTHKPATNADFWEAKRSRTVERDSQALAVLANGGWTAMTVWECELRDLAAVADSLHLFLGPPGRHPHVAAGPAGAADSQPAPE